jgi:hypothetical protein
MSLSGSYWRRNFIKKLDPNFSAQIAADVKTRRYRSFLGIDVPGVSRYNSLVTTHEKNTLAKMHA